jgi:hypothetical protein
MMTATARPQSPLIPSQNPIEIHFLLYSRMEQVLIKVLIQPNDTSESLKNKAKTIFQSYINKPPNGLSWMEIVENEYVIFKIFF